MKRVLLLTTRTLPTSLLLAMLGVMLLDGEAWGLNLPLFALACFVAVLNAVRTRERAFGGENVVAGSLAVAWSCAFVLRDSPVLHALAAFALAVTLYFVYLRREFTSSSIPVSALFTRVPPVARAFLRGPVCAVRQELAHSETVQSFNVGHSLAIARGLVLSVPVLTLFGWLLISADARFAGFAWDLLQLDFASALRSTVTFAVCFWIAVHLLRAHTVHVGAQPCEFQVPLQPLEVITALIVLDVLLALYIGVQLTYFVGGDALVRTARSLTYAQYARRGFFELVTVAALTVPLLLYVDWLCERARGAARAAQRLASGATIALIALIGWSAMHRLALYARAYGLTEQRFYAAAVLVWVIALLAWIAWTVLRGRRERFLCGAFATALIMVGGLMLLNPDARIVQYNIARAEAGRTLDVDYLLSLSADAAPALSAARGALSRDQRMAVENALFLRAMVYSTSTWQGWNWSRHKARQALSTRPGRR